MKRFSRIVTGLGTGLTSVGLWTGVDANAGEPPAATTEAVCRRAEAPPVIDGKLDEPAWARAERIDQFPAYWIGRASTPGATVARLLWDDEAIYFGAEMVDADLTSHGVKHNDRLWLGDVIELFFKPKDDSPAYYEFQVNPKSLRLELAFPHRGFPFETLAARPSLGMRAAAVPDGTVDQHDDVDRGWTVEASIPWTAFEPTGGRPKPGDVWRFAICRFDFSGDAAVEPTASSSAPLTEFSFHRYEDYGRLTFRK